MKKFAFVLFTIALAPIAAPVWAGSDTEDATKPVRKPDHHNVGWGSLALKGYDPVSYFPEGGGKPVPGKKEHAHKYQDVWYRFASEQNRAAFLENPAKYEPAHGGWCSYAIAEKGSKVKIDPDEYIVHDGRLFLFYNDDTRKGFQEDLNDFEQRADTKWKDISGETPRKPKQAQE